MAFNQNLTEEQRSEVWSDLMKKWSVERENSALNKSDLKFMVDSVDQWITDNAANVYAGFPPELIGKLSEKQLADIFLLTVNKKL